jgi:hypothetical protein
MATTTQKKKKDKSGTNNNEPATIQPAAEAELTLGAERTKNKLANTLGTENFSADSETPCERSTHVID